MNTAPSRRALRPEPAATARTAAPAARTRTRPRKARAVGFTGAVLAILVTCGLALTYVSETAAATQASYRIQALRIEHAHLLARQEQIRYSISLASSAGRIDADAQQAGLAVTPVTRYLPGSASPIALSRREPPADAPQGLLEALAVALGRPAEAEAKGR